MIGLVFACSLLPPAVAAVPPGPGAAAEPARVSADDWALTLRARKALRRDERLGPLNVGVTVRDGTARLWGPVPTDDLARRAREVVAAVPGVRGVASEVVVRPGPEPAPESGVAARPRPSDPVEPLPAVADPTAAVSRFEEPRPDPPAEPAPAVAPPATLDPPAALPTLPAAAPVSVVKKESAELAIAAEAIRQADPRYRGLRVTFEGGVARVSGSARPSHAWELAEALSQLPGVERVRMGQITPAR